MKTVGRNVVSKCFIFVLPIYNISLSVNNYYGPVTIGEGGGGGMGRGQVRGGNRDQQRAGRFRTRDQVGPGPWQCECGYSNWRSRKECNRCKAPKPEVAGISAGEIFDVKSNIILVNKMCSRSRIQRKRPWRCAVQDWGEVQLQPRTRQASS